MDKLVAVGIQNGPVYARVTGYTSRGKNRKRVWSFDVPHAEKHLIPEKCREAETQRETDAKPYGGLT